MDALTIIGIIGFGLQTCKGLLSYYQSYKNSRDDIAELCHSIEAIQATLALLQDNIDQIQAALASTELVEDAIHSCDEGFAQLKRKLGKIQDDKSAGGFRMQARLQLKRVSYPFKESTILKLRDVLHDRKSDLNLVLQAFHIDTTSLTLDRLTTVDGKITRLSSDVAIVDQNVMEVKSNLEASEKNRRRDEILHWLCTVDPSSIHQAVYEKRAPDTGNWFLEGSEFRTWATSDSLLWLNGEIGRGKSCLCSTVIEYTRQYCAMEAACELAYFYFSFADGQKQTAIACLSSLLRQLCGNTVPESLQQLYERCNKQQCRPRLDEVKEALLSVIEEVGEVFIIMDALDECPDDPDGLQRAVMLKWIVETSSAKRNVHIFFTSRNDSSSSDVADAVRSHPRLIEVSIDATKNGGDIRLYLSSQFQSNNRLKEVTRASEVDIQNVLVEKADGMFQWVYCQLLEFKRLKIVRWIDIESILSSLPRTLDEVYIRVLNTIDAKYSSEVSKALQWLSHSLRPLSVEELNEACIIAPDADVALHKQDQIFGDGISRLLSGLVKRQTREGRPELHLSHFSVKEFLTSNAVQSSLPQYGFRENEAHALIARSCIAYMFYYSSSPEKTSTEADLDIFPLLGYSCRFWFEHSRLAGETHEQLTSLIIRLLRSEIAWDDCLKVYDPCWSYERPFQRIIVPNLCLPLGWTAVLGLESAAKVLLEEGTEDINANQNNDISQYHTEGELEEAERASYIRGPSRDPGQTALIKAVLNGHENMVRLLIKNGAAVDHVDPDYDTAVAAANSSKGNREDILKALLESGANPNGADGQGQSPLQTATLWGTSLSLCKLLLEYGADPDGQGDYIYPNPLSAAADMGADDVVELLLEKGAKINESVFYYALSRTNGHHPGRICELLLQRGVNLNPTCGSNRDQPLAIALRHGWEDIAKLMLAKGAEVDPDDASCLTAGNTLQAAVICGSIEIITLLLDKGVDVNAPAVDVTFWSPLRQYPVEYYATPLQAAAFFLRVDAIRLLLERGADVNAEGRPYGSALWAVGAAIAGDCSPEKIKSARSICALLIAHHADWRLASGFRDQNTKDDCLKGLQRLMPSVIIDMDYHDD